MEILIQNNQLKRESEVFHVYANSLCPIKVDHPSRSISLKFELLREHLEKKYWKSGEKVFLLDEIYERTLKTHREQIYCVKFVIPEIILERTKIVVEICSERYEDVVATAQFTIEQSGYPDHIKSISNYVPDLRHLTGGLLASRLDEIFERHSFHAPNIIDLFS